MSSIFSKIVSGELPSYKVAEDDRFLAFLDITPLAEGHTLVIPKQEIDYIFDMDDELLADLHVFAKQVAVKLRAAVPCKRIGVAVIGLEVPHTHIHLVPLQTVADLNFAAPKKEFTGEQLNAIAERIRQS